MTDAVLLFLTKIKKIKSLKKKIVYWKIAEMKYIY